MFVKLKNIICHPSRIGMYILDHAGSIFGYFFFFFLVTTVLFAVRDMSKKVFNGNVTNAIVDALVSVDELKDTTYKEEKLSGNSSQSYSLGTTEDDEIEISGTYNPSRLLAVRILFS